MPQLIDLSGSRVGSLMVLGPGQKLYGSAAWVCQCDCGAVKTIAGDSLRRGASKSCGCKRSAITSKRSVKDLTGRRFGRLLVDGRSGSIRRKAVWRCLCDCGAATEVVSDKLLSGHTSSCGCARSDQPRLTSKKLRSQGVAQSSRRRARVRGAGGSYTADQINELNRKQRGRCANCREKLGDTFHRDHRVALSKGGRNDIGNIELLCTPCNLRKHAKDPVDWAQENGRLI